MDRVAKLTDTEIGTRPISLNRATAIVGSDMSLLAQWTGRIYGRADPIQRSPRGEHQQKEDDRMNQFRRAMAVHRFFEAFKKAEPIAYQIIWYVYLERTGGTASGIGDLYGEVGQRFASKDRREVWERKHKDSRSPAMRNEGKRLHDDAAIKYANMRCQQNPLDRYKISPHTAF